MTMLQVDHGVAEGFGGMERSALGRAQLLIDAFSPDTPVLSLGALARKANLPKSTAHRYVEQMVGLGWLERRHTGYRIGIKLFEMGELCERRNNLCRAAATHLLTLTQRTGLSSYLSVLDHDTVLCLDRASAPGSTMPTRAGRRIRFPVLTTTFGKAIVAFESADEISHQVESFVDQHHPTQREQAREAIFTELHGVRDAGYAIGASRRNNFWFLGVPLRNSGRPIASITVAAPRKVVDARVIDLAVQAAAGIWNDLFPTRRPRSA